MRELSARFAGQADRSGPLAFGHAHILRAILVDDDQTRDILPMVFDIPDLPVERVIELVSVLLTRHESLRTRYRLTPPVTQLVAGTGEQLVRIVEADEDPGAVAVRTAEQLRTPAFDFAAAPPLRVAVVTVADVAKRLVWVVSHVAMDAATCEILLREWTALTEGRELPPTGTQPLDVVELERQPSVRRMGAAALRYWRTQLERVPQAMLPIPARDAARSTTWHPGVRVRSRVAMKQLAEVSARTGASGSMIVLAAIDALVCRHSGLAECVTTSLSGNRVPRALRGLFGTLSQDALLCVPVPGSGTFDELIGRVRSASLSAYRAAWYDVAQIWSVIGEVTAARGASYARDLVFNDMSQLSAGPDGEVVTRGAAARLPGVWVPGDVPLTVTDPELTASVQPQDALNIPTRFMVYVYRLDTELDVFLHVDPVCLDADQLAEFARSLLRLLAQAARRDVPLRELDSLSALAPMPHGPGWALVDGCWVEVSAVRAMVAEVLGELPHLVVLAPGRITCFVAGPASPEDLHARCVATLPGRVTALAPHEYVICADPPPDPSDEDSWAAREVVARGTGRGAEVAA